MISKKTHALTTGAMIAALYVVFTYLAEMLGLSRMAIQLRFSEALTVLPIFTPAAVPGLFAGCLLANLLTGAALWDVLFGSLATLIGAFGTRMLRQYPVSAVCAPILSNTVIIPFVLRYAYGTTEALPYLFATVFAGELLSCGVLGLLLYRLLKRWQKPLGFE